MRDPDSKNKAPGPVLDLFKLVRIENVEPVALEEGRPNTWREVLLRFNRAMMRILVGLPEFVAETVEGMTRAIRGATMPEKIETKVFRAHAQADALEEDLQDSAREAQNVQLPSDDGDLQDLRRLLTRLQAQGLKIHVEEREDGALELGVVRPELEGTARDALDALPIRKQARKVPSAK